MINVISFSGGRTSAFLCYLMLHKFGKENCKFIFFDTGAEHPKTYDFVRKVNDWIKLDLTCLRLVASDEIGIGNGYEVVSIGDIKHDLKPFKDMMRKYGTPAINSPFCTDRMKTNIAKKYCDDTFGKNNYHTWLGMRIDEPNRLKNLDSNQIDAFENIKKKSNIRYLAEISDFTKQDVLEFWDNQSFNLEINEHLGNCVFCIKKGANKLALAARQEPELARVFIDAINDDSVRDIKELPMRYPDKRIMYRGNMSLESIIATNADYSEYELMQTIRSMKQLDTGSCSESCEAFSSDNLDLFEDAE